MDPLSAIGLGIQAAGGIANFFANQSANDKAQLLQSQAFQQWMALQLPNPADQQLALQQLKSVGMLSPQLETQLNQAPSALSKVQADPQTVAAQQNALNSLQQQGHGGLNLQDDATLQAAQQQNQDQARGNSQAIMQNLAQRGASNSGFGVAAQLDNAQHSADQNATAGLNVAANAQQRALQAIQGAGSLAGTIQAANLGQQNTAAQAQDAINQFNTNNALATQHNNVNNLNAAQSANLGNAQRIADSNVGINNGQQEYNKGLQQQNFNNQITQLKGAQGVTDNMSGLAQQAGQNAGNLATGLANQAGGALTTKANRDYWSNYFGKQAGQKDAVNSAYGSGQYPVGLNQDPYGKEGY